MAKLHSFEDYAKIRQEQVSAEIEAQKEAAREETVRSFKDLLAEYGVTKVSELDEDQREEFFSKLDGTDLNESLSLVTEGTRSFFGKISKKSGDIEAVYMHYDGYPENMLPLIQKGYSGAKKKNIDVVLKNGAGSGLEADPKKINYYNDGDEPLTGNIGAIRDFISDAKQSWAEFIYLYDERDGKWYMADTYEDDNMVPAFEAFIGEAVIVTGKRDAKKVMNTYIKFFEKYPALGPDAMGVPADHVIGAVKELYAAAMEDANFSREVPSTVNKMKGRLFAKEVKVAELNNYTVKISTGKLSEICRDHGSNIAGAAKWSGLAIVEGTAMYLDHINYGKFAEALLNAFNATFESAEELEARILEGNEFGAARAKAIADGKDEFEVDGKKYKVTKVDADDKENAEEFANESEINGENPNPAGYPSVSGDSEDVEETEGEEVEVMEEGEVSEAEKMKVGTFVRYKKDKDFTGGKIKSIKGSNAEIHNWDGSTTELPLKDLEYVKSWNESAVSEAEVKSADEFKEYAFNVLQQAFGDDFDEAKAQEVVDGILSKVDGDFGAAIGMLQSSLG